ncbi:MAG: malonate transporter [Rickettsiales bacterium]|jgi:malonate transporter
MLETVNIIFAIAPIFTIIIFGYFLRKIGKVPKEFWSNSDFLIYWVFIPSLFFTKISQVDLASYPIFNFSIILCLIVAFTLIYSLFSLKSFNLSRSSKLPTIQGCCRVNTVIALAISSSLYGPKGLEIAIIGTAILAPLINILMPIFLIFVIKDDKIDIISRIKKDIIANPIILSISLGFIFNYYDIKNVLILHSSLSTLSNAALPIMLLSLGANLKIKEMRGQISPIVISSVGKLILTPVIAIILCFFTILPADLTQIAVIYGSVPTGVVVYTLVKKANGDVKLASAIVTAQILLSFITMPIFIILSEMLLSI